MFSIPRSWPVPPAPAAFRAALAANADAEVLRRYDDGLDAAFEEAREHGDLTPLVQTVRRWWFEADAWRDPTPSASSRPALRSTRTKGRRPREPHKQRRDSRKVRRLKNASMGAGRPAQPMFEAIDPAVRALLESFMDAVVIVDPIEYQRHPGEPG